jgi:hypothetical protein
MISLLYVSRATFRNGGENRQLTDIMTVARERNARLGVTGALICMGGYFAQILEGDDPAVNQLMVDILRDRRHSDIRIIEVVAIERPRFSSWGLALVPASPGPRSYIEILIGSEADPETGAAAAALRDYMIRFADG